MQSRINWKNSKPVWYILSLRESVAQLSIIVKWKWKINPKQKEVIFGQIESKLANFSHLPRYNGLGTTETLRITLSPHVCVLVLLNFSIHFLENVGNLNDHHTIINTNMIRILCLSQFWPTSGIRYFPKYQFFESAYEWRWYLVRLKQNLKCESYPKTCPEVNFLLNISLPSMKSRRFFKYL